MSGLKCGRPSSEVLKVSIDAMDEERFWDGEDSITGVRLRAGN